MAHVDSLCEALAEFYEIDEEVARAVLQHIEENMMALGADGVLDLHVAGRLFR